ncbi:ATP-binding protein [Desulfolithobacter sp.]
MQKPRLLWQIFPASLLITLGAMLAVTWYTSTTIRSFYLQQMRSDIEARARLLEAKIIHLAAEDQKQLQEFCQRAGRRAATRITVVAADGTVLADSNENPIQMDNHSNRPELRAALAGRTGSSLRFSKTLGQTMLYVAIPIKFQDTPPGALRLSVPATSLNSILSSIHTRIFLGSLLVVVLAGLLSLYIARRISRPLEEMKRGARRLARGETGQPIRIKDASMSAEMAELARSLNEMARQINQRIQTISRQHNELEAVFGSMTEAVVAIDTEERIIRMNRAATRLFGLDQKAVKGKSIEGLIRNSDLLVLIRSVFETNEPSEEEINFFDGSHLVTLQARAVALHDSENESIGVLVVMTDVTRLNRLENLRRDFVANVSHELKTPITAIRGYVETILEGALDSREDTRRFLEIVKRQTTRLEAIIDDLLTLSRIEDRSSKDDIKLSRMRIRPVLEAALQTCAVKAREKEVVVEIDCNESLEARINQPLLEQAVINLLSNAITYSPAGSTVWVRARKSQDNEGVEISVADQGIGIAREHQERLFERFYRCDKARSREQGGTGLGLAIVKHIAQSHGGMVTVSSSPGRGSVFTLKLRR